MVPVVLSALALLTMLKASGAGAARRDAQRLPLPKRSIAQIRRELAAAEKRSHAMAKARAALPAGSSRARVTTINARWMSAAEHRNRLLEELRKAEDIGLPEPLAKVSPKDLPLLKRELRRVVNDDRKCVQSVTLQKRQTFPRKIEAVRSLVNANPQLDQFLESECGHGCGAYKKWLANGRKGPKPPLAPGDGRFDAFNEALDKQGKRKIGNWLEALYATTPPTKRWEDFDQRLPLLEDSSGLRIDPPEETIRVLHQKHDVDLCHLGAEAEAEKVVTAAKRGRLRKKPKLEDAPF